MGMKTDTTERRDMDGDALAFATLIVSRCREEGRQAAQAGLNYTDCPYAKTAELEKAGWLDGWSRERQLRR